jgi:hypothetical protein
MAETSEPTHESRPQPETVTYNNQIYECHLLPDGTYNIYAPVGAPDLGVKARVAAIFSEQKGGEEIIFNHNEGEITIKKENGLVTFSCDVKYYEDTVRRIFTPDGKKEVRNFRKEWLKKPDVQEKLNQIVDLLTQVRNAGKYQNYYEVETLAEAFELAINNWPEIIRINDPLSQVAALVHELAHEFDIASEGDINANFDTFEHVRNYIGELAYTQYHASMNQN